MTDNKTRIITAMVARRAVKIRSVVTAINGGVIGLSSPAGLEAADLAPVAAVA